MAKKSFNPFKLWGSYLTGFIFAIIFFIMFFSSQITQNQIGGLDIDETIDDIELRFQVVCDQSGLPPVDIELCRNTLSDALEEGRQSIGSEIDEEIGFFTSFFFQPSTTQLGLAVIVLFSLGFIVGWGIQSAIRTSK